MKLFWLVVLVLVEESLTANYVTKYIEVPVDHFSFTTNETFKLKYLINDTFWIDDAPIFFYTGNEGTIENFAENTGFMFDIAPEFNALLVFAEHRYYGTSLPFGNLSNTSPKYLGYLSSSQALADYVVLINYLQSEYASSDTIDKLPVVAFGGSYGGMLASWFRMKYPASVVGAIASSAPIWQFQGITPCQTFNIIVTQVYKNSNPLQDCSAPIQKLWGTIRSTAATEDGKDWISKEWKLCTPLKTQSDLEDLINWVNGIIVNIAMVNYPYPTSFLAPLPADPVRNFCYKLQETEIVDNKTLLTAAGSALEIYTNFTQQTTCNNINITAESLGEDAWDFQACTEMIMPMCSTDEDMFENAPWNFETFENGCLRRWGVKQLHAEFPILEYGGKDIKSASNIVFSNGLLDPWSGGGVLSNISSSVVAIVIPEAAHHLDLRSENQYDPESVIKARRFHVNNIRKWVYEYYYTNYREFYTKSPWYEKVQSVKV